MTTVQLDAATLAKLGAGIGPVDIVNDAGRVVGRFTPGPAWDNDALVPWDPAMTREDLDRLAAEPGGSSLADIMAELERRGCTG